MTYYFVTAVSNLPEKKSWCWIWDGRKLIPETRTFDEVGEAAQGKGHDISFCEMWVVGVPPWECDKIKLAATAAMRTGGATIENVWLDCRVEVTMKIITR